MVNKSGLRRQARDDRVDDTPTGKIRSNYRLEKDFSRGKTQSKRQGRTSGGQDRYKGRRGARKTGGPQMGLASRTPYSEGNVSGATDLSVVSRFTHTKVPYPGLTAYSDHGYLVCKNQYLDFETNMGAALDTAEKHIVTIEPDVIAVSDPTLVKDWVDAQRLSFDKLIFYGAQYLHYMGTQASVRKLAKLVTEDDATGYWKQETYDAHIAAAERSNLYIPAASVAMALSANVVMQTSPGYAVRNIPPVYAMNFIPTVSSANALTLRNNIKVNQLGMLHAAKTKLPMVKLTAQLIDNCYRSVSIGTDVNEAMFQACNYLMAVDDGAAETIASAISAADTQFYGNSTTDWTNAMVVWAGDQAPDIWGTSLLQRRYAASGTGGNYMGALYINSPGNDKFGAKWIELMGTTFDELSMPGDASFLAQSTPWTPYCNWTIAAHVDPLAAFLIKAQGIPGGVFYDLPGTRVQWLDMQSLWMQKALKGQIGFGGGRVVTSDQPV